MLGSVKTIGDVLLTVVSSTAERRADAKSIRSLLIATQTPASERPQHHVETYGSSISAPIIAFPPTLWVMRGANDGIL